MAELSTSKSLTFILTTGNTADDIRQLINGFKILASKGTNTANYPILKTSLTSFSSTPIPPFSRGAMGDQTPNISPRAAFFCTNETVEIRESVGRFSAELICPYPPGIPVLMPGELITLEAIEYLLTVLKDGSNIVGASDRTLQTIKVLSD